MSDYDLNYQYKDSIGHVSGGMTSQGSSLRPTNEYWYQTLSTTTGYLYFVADEDMDWRNSGYLWIYGYGSVIYKRYVDLYDNDTLLEKDERGPFSLTLTNNLDERTVFTTNGFGGAEGLVTTIPIFSRENVGSIQRYIETGDTSGALNRDQIDTSAIATKVYVDGKTKPNITISWETTSGEDSDTIH